MSTKKELAKKALSRLRAMDYLSISQIINYNMITDSLHDQNEFGVIYIAKSGPYIKVGYTGFFWHLLEDANRGDITHSDCVLESVKRRFTGLQCGNPIMLECAGVIIGRKSDEKLIHSALEPYRHRSEWFNLCDEVREFLIGIGVKPSSEIVISHDWWPDSVRQPSSQINEVCL